MKKISREINRYLMELDECENDRSKYDILNKLSKYVSSISFDITHTNKGVSYYDLATNEMMNDIHRYLNRYIEEHPNLVGTEYYSINLLTFNGKTFKLYMNVESGKFKEKSVQYMINEFPRSTLYYILGLDSKLGEEYIKYNRSLVKSEYDRFIKLRAENPTYYLPYIRGIINGLNYMKLA